MEKALSSPRIPQPPLWPLLQNIPALDRERPVSSMMTLAKQLGPLFRLSFPGRTMLVASSHALAKELCDTKRFQKTLGGPLKELRAVVGKALFTAENDDPEWGRAHRILRTAFSTGAMQSYFAPMLEIAQQLVKHWEDAGEHATHDVSEQMTRLTLDTIALCGFDYRFHSFARDTVHPFVESMVWALKESGKRSLRGPWLNRLFFRAKRTYEHHIERMNQTVDTVIQARKESGVEQLDLLGRMLSGVDPETSEKLSDEEIRYQIITFLVAGHETTSGLLSFTLHALLKHPAILAKAIEEVDAVLGPPSRVPQFEDLRSLRYLDQILRESLRLWPTAPGFSMTPKQPTTLESGIALNPGDNVLILLPQLHRDPAIWENPEDFVPERFAPENKIPLYAWMPFGIGQRACIGRLFAMQEAVLVLGMILQRFSLQAEEPFDLHIQESLTMKPEHFRIRVKCRTPTS